MRRRGGYHPWVGTGVLGDYVFWDFWSASRGVGWVRVGVKVRRWRGRERGTRGMGRGRRIQVRGVILCEGGFMDTDLLDFLVQTGAIIIRLCSRMIVSS